MADWLRHDGGLAAVVDDTPGVDRDPLTVRGVAPNLWSWLTGLASRKSLRKSLPAVRWMCRERTSTVDLRLLPAGRRAVRGRTDRVDPRGRRRGRRGLPRHPLSAPTRVVRARSPRSGPELPDGSRRHRSRMGQPGESRSARPAEDWVRRELLEAAKGGTPIVPVLVGRDTMPSVAGLDLDFDERCLTIDPNDPEHLEADLRRLLEITGSAGRGGRERAVRAVLALLRHVLPRPQRSMSNDLTVARCVASELDRGDWLQVRHHRQPARQAERLGRRLRDPQRGRGRTAHREPPQPPRDPVAVDRPRHRP